MAAPDRPAPRFPSLNRPSPRRSRRLRIGWLLCAAWLGVAGWNVFKPLPPGVHVAGAAVATPDSAITFLADVTAQRDDGSMQREPRIHAATLELVRNARDFLVVDYFLFNAQGGPRGPLSYEGGLTPVSAQLIEALRSLKQAQPSLPVLVITDPINDYYRGTAPPELAALQDLGVDVVVTRLSALRDSNPLYSATWRLFTGWWMPTRGEGWLPNLLDGAGPKLRLGALLRLPNFKANHRKLAITGDGRGSLLGIVASSNPHDASSAHSNVALRVAGEALRPLLQSELAVAGFSGWKGGALEALARKTPPLAEGSANASVDTALRTVADTPADAAAARATESGVGAAASPSAAAQVAVLTEGAISEALLARFAATRAGDAIDVAQFYLAERGITRALLEAAARGVSVRVLLDPNRDAFGFEKGGIPNRPVGQALVRDSGGRIALRWYRTSGEQFHAKFTAVRSGGRIWFTLGSANFTRRNIGDYNLEANVAVEVEEGAVVADAALDWFETLWSNAGANYSDPADTWAEDSALRLWRARLMEATGLSTF